MNQDSEFSRVYHVDSFSKKENRVTISATDEESLRLSERLKVVYLKDLSANFVIKSKSSGEVQVTGMIVGVVGQYCVITNNPMKTSLAMEITSRFLDPKRITSLDDNDAEFDLGEDDLPDPIIEGQIDLGEFVCQHLSLEIDPYPKAENVTFSEFSTNTDTSIDEKQPNPFAILAKIKDKL